MGVFYGKETYMYIHAHVEVKKVILGVARNVSYSPLQPAIPQLKGSGSLSNIT